MSANASDRKEKGWAALLPVPGAASRLSARSRRGFTLVEVAVALSVSGLLVGSLALFFKSFGRTFNVQEQVTDRDLNAHYTVKRLSEVLMAAGANLPSKGWQIIVAPDGNPGSRVRLAVNPRGGIQYIPAATSGYEIQVDDAKGFARAAAVLLAPVDQSKAYSKVAIDAAYNGDGFVKGVKPVGTGALIRLSGHFSAEAGDVAYAYDEEEYKLVGTNLMLGDMILAENIESLTVAFMTAGQAATDQWSAMRSARITIRGRTRQADPTWTKDGGYRMIDLSTDVLLRNRI